MKRAALHLCEVHGDTDSFSHEAENRLRDVQRNGLPDTTKDRLIAEAQVHATLAVAWAIDNLHGYLRERDEN